MPITFLSNYVKGFFKVPLYMNEENGTDTNQIKKNKKGRACGMNGRQDTCTQCFGGDT